MTRSIDLSAEALTAHELPSRTVIDATGGLVMPAVVEPLIDEQVQAPEMSAEAAGLFAQLDAVKAGVRAFEQEYRSQDKQPYIFDRRYAQALEQADPIVRQLAGLGYKNVPPLW